MNGCDSRIGFVCRAHTDTNARGIIPDAIKEHSSPFLDIEGLTKLESLSLGRTEVSDFSPLFKLPKMFY